MPGYSHRVPQYLRGIDANMLMTLPDSVIILLSKSIVSNFASETILIRDRQFFEYKEIDERSGRKSTIERFT